MFQILLLVTHLVEGFSALVSAGGLNLPDKRVDPDCWLRSGFESPRRQLGFRLFYGSHQLRTLRCQAALPSDANMCLIWGANNILPFFQYNSFNDCFL